MAGVADRFSSASWASCGDSQRSSSSIRSSRISRYGSVNGRPPIAPQDHRWTGSTTGIATAKQEWDEILAAWDLDAPIDWLMPEPQPLGFIASWVTVELTKNLAEINQMQVRHANSTT